MLDFTEEGSIETSEAMNTHSNSIVLVSLSVVHDCV